MNGRIIINRKAIDQIIVERVRACPPELALMAFRKPLQNEAELYAPQCSAEGAP